MKKSRFFCIQPSFSCSSSCCHFPSPEIALKRHRDKDRGTRGSLSILTFQKTEEKGNDSCCFRTSWENRDSWLPQLARRSDYWARWLFTGRSTGFIQSPSEIANIWQTLVSLQQGGFPPSFHCSHRKVSQGWLKYALENVSTPVVLCWMQQDELKEFRSWLICVWEEKCHHNPWVWETTRTSGVVMMVSLCSMGCKKVASTLLLSWASSYLREKSVVGIFLFPFPVSMFKGKVKKHYLKKTKPCLSFIFTVPGNGTQSVSKGVWFIWPPTSVYIRSRYCSIPLTFIGSTVASIDLKIWENSCSVSPISRAHVKLNNTMLIFMLIDRFTP